jgi:hypothetical protein
MPSFSWIPRAPQKRQEYTSTPMQKHIYLRATMFYLFAKINNNLKLLEGRRKRTRNSDERAGVERKKKEICEGRKMLKRGIKGDKKRSCKLRALHSGSRLL